MGSNKVSANGIELAYEAFGDEADPPLLLIMGLGVHASVGTTGSAARSPSGACG